MTLEGWKSIFEIGGVTLVFLSFVFGAGALYTANRLNVLQDEQLRQFDKGLTEAKTELGKQQVLASDAVSRVAGLEKDAADAKAEMAKQQARAATAERSLLELQGRIKDRRLSGGQYAQLLTLLKPVKPEEPTFVSSILFDGEGREYARDINKLLLEAEWTTAPEPIQSTPGNLARPVGLILVVHDGNALPSHAIALFNAFTAAGLHPTWGQNDSMPPARVSVLVGSKPFE
jgi:hypothetical protein